MWSPMKVEFCYWLWMNNRWIKGWIIWLKKKVSLWQIWHQVTDEWCSWVKVGWWSRRVPLTTSFLSFTTPYYQSLHLGFQFWTILRTLLFDFEYASLVLEGDFVAKKTRDDIEEDLTWKSIQVFFPLNCVSSSSSCPIILFLDKYES